MMSNIQPDYIAVDEPNPNTMLFPASYNTLDEGEGNTDILRAEIMSMANPDTVEYADEFYTSLKNIEMSCEVDMNVYCPDDDANIALFAQNILTLDPSMFFFIGPSDPLFDTTASRRKLVEEVKSSVKENDGLKFLNSIRDTLFRTSRRSPNAVDLHPSDATPPFNPTPFAKSSPAKSGLKTIAVVDTKVSLPSEKKMNFIHDHHDHPEDHHPHPDLHHDMVRPGAHHVGLRGIKPRKLMEIYYGSDSDSDSGSDLDSDSDSDSDSGSDEEEEFMGSHHHHHGHHKYHAHHDGQLHGPPDMFYSGALGFGAPRDMCLYENFEKLSTPCQNSVVSHYQLRQTYWEETAPKGCDGLTILLWSSVAVLGFVLIRRLRGCPRHQKVKKIMDTIRNNPNLKAQIEMESGVQVPEKKKCGANRCARGFVLILLTLLSAFLIAVSSLLFTVAILTAMIPPPQEGQDMDYKPPSVPFAVFVLLSVCAAEVCSFFLILRGCKGCAGQNQGPVTPSAPSLDQSPENNSRPFSRYQTWIERVPFRSWRLLSRQPVAEGGYALLDDETQHGNSEMVSVSQHGRTVFHPTTPYTQCVVLSQQPVDGSNTAQPVSVIQMI